MTENDPKLPQSIYATALRTLKLFNNVDANTLKAIAAVCQVFTYSKGETITQNDTELSGIYVVITGQINGYRHFPISERIVNIILGPGTILGLTVLIPNKRSVMTATALNTVKIFYIRKEDAQNLIRKFPDLSYIFFDAIYTYVSSLAKTLTFTQGPTLESRLATWLLLEIANNSNSSHGEDIQEALVEIPISKIYLSKQLGATPVSLSRTLGVLKTLGIINVKGKRITILNRRKLKELAKPQISKRDLIESLIIA